jgi:hypothetical protein
VWQGTGVNEGLNIMLGWVKIGRSFVEGARAGERKNTKYVKEKGKMGKIMAPDFEGQTTKHVKGLISIFEMTCSEWLLQSDTKINNLYFSKSEKKDTRSVENKFFKEGTIKEVIGFHKFHAFNGQEESVRLETSNNEKRGKVTSY